MDEVCLVMLKNYLDAYCSSFEKPDLAVEMKKINQLERFIKSLNKVHIKHSIQTPFLHWLFSAITTSSFTEAMKQQLLYLKTCGLNFLVLDNQKSSYLSGLITILNDNDPSHMSLLKFLIEEIGCSIQTHETFHPIPLALIQNKIEIYKYLAEKLPIFSHNADTILTMAARYGLNPLIKKNLEHSPHLLNQADGSGFTPLMYAVLSKKANSLQLLLDKGADLYSKTPDGMTAAHWLFYGEHESIFKNLETMEPYQALIDLIFEINDSRLQDNYGRYPLHYYLAQNNLNLSLLTDWLSQHNNLLFIQDAHNRNILHYAAHSDNSLLLAHMATHYPELKLDATDLGFKTALHYAGLNTISWIAENGNLPEEAYHSALLDAISSKEKNRIACLLGTGKCKLDVYFDYEDTKKTTHNSLLHALIDFEMLDLITAFDLLNLMDPIYPATSYRNTANQTAFSLLCDMDFKRFNQTDLQGFIDYTLTYMTQHPVNQITDLPGKLLELFLAQKKIDIHDATLTAGICYQIETYFYEEAVQSGTFPQSYEKKLTAFIERYQPNLNQREGKTGLHIVAKLAQLGEIAYPRIEFLYRNFKTIPILDLDPRGSSLLHIACETEHFELVRWCFNELALPITHERGDGRNALDIAIYQKHRLICRFLTVKLGQEKWKAYISARQTDEFVISELIQHKFFGFKPNNKQLKALAKLKNSALQGYFIPLLPIAAKLSSAAAPSSGPVVLTGTQQKISFQQLAESISGNQMNVIQAITEQEAVIDFDSDPQIAAQQALDLLVLASSQEQHTILFQLWRMQAFKNTLPTDCFKLLEELLTRCGQRMNLSIFLDEPTLALLTTEDRLRLLGRMQALQLFAVLVLALDSPEFYAVVHLEDNNLLRAAIQDGQVFLCEKLLQIEAVANEVAAQYKSILRLANVAEQENILITLLSLPQVIAALEGDDFNLVRECLGEVDSLLHHKLNELPTVQNWMQHHARHLKDADQSTAVYEFQTIDSSLTVAPNELTTLPELDSSYGYAKESGDIPVVASRQKNRSAVLKPAISGTNRFWDEKQPSYHSQPRSKLLDEPAPQLTHRPVPPLMRQPMPPLMHQPMPSLMHQPMPPLMHQPVPPLMHYPISPLMYQPMPPLVYYPISQLIPPLPMPAPFPLNTNSLPLAFPLLQTGNIVTDRHRSQNSTIILDAIVTDNLELFYDLLIEKSDISQQWIRNMALTAVHFNAKTIFLDYFMRCAVISQNVNVCQRLLKEAMSLGNTEISAALFWCPSIQRHLDRCAHQLLRTAVEHRCVEIALSLLTLPLSDIHLEAADYYVFRHAAASGLIEIVEKLLNFDEVVENVAVMNNWALRKAHTGLLAPGISGDLRDCYQRIILRLLSLPQVLDYAGSQGFAYTDMIVLFAQQQIILWENQPDYLSNPQRGELLFFDAYPAIQTDISLRNRISKLKQVNHMVSLASLTFLGSPRPQLSESQSVEVLQSDSFGSFNS